MTTTSSAVPKSGSSARVRVQRFGTFLSGMVMPNIPAFIAWGIITAFFIQTGWTPNGILGGFGTTNGVANPGLVGPIITWLIPLLIASQGGRMVYGTRGAVVGTVMTMGVIVGSLGTTMILGAMICGPLGGYLIKQVDRIWENKIKAGFEMLVNNFSAGILGFGLALAGFFWLSPIFDWIATILGDGVKALVNAHLLPLASIFIEPAKVVFLNNAINHGVLDQLGAQQVQQTGKSILFLLEANPGPGVGLLLAFMFFGVGVARATAPGAIIIQFFGGIHEIYFPYVLSKPMLLLAVIAGGATGVATNVTFQSGLVAPASPGSIFAVIFETAKDSYVGVILSVILSAAVSFFVTAIILRASRNRDLAAEASGEQDALVTAVARNAANKGRESRVGDLLGTGTGTTTASKVQTIVFACDAGMGSSAMGATVLRNKIKKAGIEGVTVVNKAIANLTDDVDIVITQEQLTERARQKTPSAEHYSVDNFMSSTKYDEVVAEVTARNS
ncbi:MAG: mannitol transporter subunit [Microbacteriaceae bacterium]|jgi:PTS system mannitol-specific IIC component|nr:mannitol transporter subunit [Microbacteriaceae bacterium]